MKDYACMEQKELIRIGLSHLKQLAAIRFLVEEFRQTIAGRGGIHIRPDEIAPNGIQYTAQPIETALTQGMEEENAGTAVSYENETEYALIQRVLGFVEHWNATESRTDEDLDEMLKASQPMKSSFLPGWVII